MAKVVKAFQKGEDFYQELLESYQDAYAKGARWYGKKVVKYYLDIDLGVLSLGRSLLVTSLATLMQKRVAKWHCLSPGFCLLF